MATRRAPTACTSMIPLAPAGSPTGCCRRCWARPRRRRPRRAGPPRVSLRPETRARHTPAVTSVGTISSLWRYPAKSMMGDEFPWLPADHGGVVGDRGWAVRDEVRGGIRGAKKIGGLMKMHARYRDEPRAGAPPPPIEIRLPDGEVLQSDEADTNDRLSRFLDHQVTLWPLQPPADLDHYRRGAPDTDDFDAEMRQIFGRERDEPLPGFEGMP